MRNTLTKEFLHSIFVYKDGSLYWKDSPQKGILAGAKAGTIKNDKYLSVSIKRKQYLVHRLIFLMNHGYLPKCVDHIDRNSLNNKIENLREATWSQNVCNSQKRITNTSGVKNVYFHKWSKKWQVKLMIEGKNTHFGSFSDFELAELVAIEAVNKYHGNFSCYRANA